MNFVKIIFMLFIVSIFCCFSFADQPESIKLKLVPYPQTVEFLNGGFTPCRDLVLVYDKSNNNVRQVAETVEGDLEGSGFSVTHGDFSNIPKYNKIEFKIKDDPYFEKEGYRLEFGRKISITASNAHGLFWGTRTLLQLLKNGPGKSVQNLSITDKPEFEYRGLLIDNARHFHSIDFHIETLKRMAFYKLNKYHIHFSDHQSYTLPSKAFPSLPTEGRHYTKEEIERIVDAANKYHIQIVPEIDVPGHAAALIRGVNKFHCGGRGAYRKLCIGKEETYKSLEKIFAEVMEMIPGEYWHLGADEVRYDGVSCQKCAARIKKENLKDGTELYHYFINRMHDFIKSKGKTMLVWEGFSPMGEPRIHKDILVCPFDIKHRGHMPIDYFNAGYNVLNTSWTPLYVADNIYMTTPEIIARWSPYMFGAGRSPQPFAYWKKYSPDDYRGRIIGGQMCSWNNEEKAEEGILFGTGPGFYEYGRPAPRIQIMAERVWTGSETTAKDLLKRVGASYWD